MTAKDLTLAETQLAAALFKDVAAITGIEVATLLGRRRDRPIVFARFIACAALRGAGFTLSRAGRALGGRDHGTVAHALIEFRQLAKVPAFKAHAAAMLARGWNLRSHHGTVGLVEARP